MKPAQSIRMKNPPHPGGFVRYEVIEAIGLSVTAAAKALGVTRAALSAVLNESARLSPEMALRIEKAFGVSMDTLMRMQNSHDIAKDRRREAEIKVASFERKVIANRPRAALHTES
ncbi:MAG: HigA family addiction module antitoxin [Deltaproteobacteria bacterium]|nr:HigA family addiction module antitoxin [Deltaproteobacteria bacterium]